VRLSRRRGYLLADLTAGNTAKVEPLLWCEGPQLKIP